MCYRAAERDAFGALKQIHRVSRLRELTAEGEECRIQILGRGEVAFYQQGERALRLAVLAGHGVIVA